MCSRRESTIPIAGCYVLMRAYDTSLEAYTVRMFYPLHCPLGNAQYALSITLSIPCKTVEVLKRFWHFQNYLLSYLPSQQETEVGTNLEHYHRNIQLNTFPNLNMKKFYD